MLYMVVETYTHGPGPVYARASERGRLLPAGLESEYPANIGWEHSSVAHAVAFARRARARRLVLFHHDPLHSDEDLALLEARAAELWNGLRPPELAREGMRLTLGPARNSLPTRKDRGVTTVRAAAGGSIIATCSKTSITSG